MITKLFSFLSTLFILLTSFAGCAHDEDPMVFTVGSQTFDSSYIEEFFINDYIENYTCEIGCDDLDFEIIRSNKLKVSTLETRDTSCVIIEKSICVVEDDMSGHDIANDMFVSFTNTKPVFGETIEPGDIIISYFVYSPFSQYLDDIVLRFDYIAGHCTCDNCGGV